MQKKLLIFFIVIVISASIFSNALLLTPKDSKAVFYVKNMAETYESLKTVPTARNLLQEPFNIELYVLSLVQMFLEGNQVNSESFFSYLDTDLCIFIQKNSNETYVPGAIIGPIDNPKLFYEYVTKIIFPLQQSGVSLYPLYEKDLNDNDYLVLAGDKNLYSESDKGISLETKTFENGFYYKVNSTEIKTSGYAHIKDNLLVGTATGKISEEDINENYLKSPQEYQFLGNLFLVSGFLPNNISYFDSLVSVVSNPEVVKNLLNASNGFEINSKINIDSDEFGTPNLKNDSFIKVYSKAKINDLIPIFEENKIEYKKITDESLKIKIKVDKNNDFGFDSSEFNSEEIPDEMSYYIWKNNDNIFISEKTNDELNSIIKSKKSLSENILFKSLSEKIGIGNLMIGFVDFSDYFNLQYGLNNNYGILFNITHKGNGNIIIDFILQ